jgi:colanic acid biosynthesis glycosyl transferase WcaI
MRVLLLAQWFDPEPGAIHGVPLARWLKQRGHEVTVLTGFPNYPTGEIYPGYRQRISQKEEIDGISVCRVPLYPSHDGSAIRRIANYVSFAVSAASIGSCVIGKHDLVYAYHPPATIGLPAIGFKATKAMPFVYHIADMWPESVVDSSMVGDHWTRKWLETMISSWCRVVYRHAAAITVLSPGFKRLLIERGVPADKVHVIYNWVDDEVFRPVPRDPRLAAELGMAGRFNIVYAGNLGPFQNVDMLIRAARLVSADRRIQVVIVGTGQQEAALRRLAGELGTDNVRFVGRRQYWEMPAINSLADVLVVSLRDLPFFTATIPQKTQVSLASGRPVLMAVRGDAADIIQKAGAGLTCPPDDAEALAKAIQGLSQMSDEDREAMGAAGRAYYLSEMSLEVGGRRVESLFRSLMERR